nr:hypothetical protein [Clostridium paraputrificum]
MSNIKCSDCNYKKLEIYSGGINRYFCTNIEATKGVGSRVICKTERHSTEITIKTSPRWCPLKDRKIV